MNWPRLAAALLASGLHAGVLYAFFTHSGSDAFMEGKGSDNFTVVATVSLESADIFNQEVREASAEAIAAKAKPVQPPAKEKEPEKAEKAGAAEPVKEVSAHKEAEKTPEKQVPVTQTASLASTPLERQQAAAALSAHRQRLWTAYEMALHSSLERHKMNPPSAKSGVVLVQITIAPSGALVSQTVLKSSGFPELDRTALASLKRASPFPPIPPEVSSDPLTLTVPFQYQTR